MLAARNALLRYCCCFIPRVAVGAEPRDDPDDPMDTEPDTPPPSAPPATPPSALPAASPSAPLGTTSLLILAAAQRMPNDTTLAGWHTQAKVVDVHDGDTVRLIVMRDGHLQQYVCRLAGIDAPELHPRRTLLNRDQHMAAARASRDRLRGLVLDSLVDVVFGRPDKYGRQLATLTTRGAVGTVPAGTDVNEYMVRAGLAVAYDGGTKA